ncbi:NADH-quinone oxidoreductase subunit E [Pararhizobium capsulatum DSM 1112]|uniref:NADH-quinone oxidoreductase subunit E n=1 Tax=Pararhizobium capsulatum DSM 1112 TaxID=1121113 RepID=A0ABU0BNS6_9HYPH|nr:NADH:ubiquinone oxidoreductase [Pararhizobium capsulatum]MDQ0319904.1 NADH-quinone oxidoreductase subunit E [Pararhizobium capsulatum DSM 1112]
MVGPKEENGKGTGPADAGADPSSAFGSADDPFGMTEWLKEVPVASLHPLMQHPVAAMAAATAIGFGVTSHFAGVMFGAMQGMAEAAQKAGTTGAETAPVHQPTQSAPVKAPKVETVERADPVEKTVKPKRNKPAARVVETVADDLKKIAGIGPKLEQVLNGMGIQRYQDIARWTTKDVQRVDEQLGFSGRIARDGWVESAKTLIKG